MSDNYVLDFVSCIKQAASQKQINADIKQLEKTINMLRLTATLAKGSSKKEINAYIKTLSNQLSTIKLKAKIDNKTLKSEVNKALNNVSFKDIDTLNIDENKTKLKVQKVFADVKTYAEKNPIVMGINISSKKNKLDNDLTTYLNKYTKINESSVLLEEANKVRDLIDAITDKKSLTEATDAFRLFKSEVSATGYTSKSTADKIKSMLGHITKIGSAFGVASMLINNFTKSLKTLRGNDTILTEISKTSEMTKNQLRELGDEAFKVASKFGQLSSNYLLAVQEMARSGYEETSKELGELSLLAQSAGNMTAENANNYLLATDAAYKYSGSVEKLNTALDGANFISNRNSASLTDITDATRVSASFAANAGVAIDELTAAEATMIATTKRAGSEIGRAFRSIVLNLQQVSGEFDGEIIDEEQLKKVEARCHSLGVELEYMKDGVATLRNPMEVLKDLAEVYNSLPDSSADKQGLISDLGGKYHANALSSLLSRWDLYEKMLSEFSQGAGSALEEAEKTAISWEGRLNSLQNSWDSFVNTLTNKEMIMGGVSFLDKLIQGAEKLTDTIGEIPVVLTTLHTAMVAMKKDYGITQLFNPETNKLDVRGNVLGIDFSAIKEQKKHFEEAEQAILHWNDKLSIGKADLDSFSSSLVKNNAQFKAYLQTTSKNAPASLAGYKAHLNAAGVSTDALRLKTILLNSAISMGIGVAIQAAVQGITYLIQREENLRQATEEAANAYKNSASSIEDYASRYEELHKALIAAKGNEEETYAIKKQLLELQTELNDKFGDEYGAVNLVTEAYKDQTEAIRELNKETAQTFLNENKAGIDKAEREMTKDRPYSLSYTGISAYSDEGKILKEIVEKYTDQGITLLDELGDGSYAQFSVHLNADAQSAYETINAFENDLRDKAKELDNEHMFDDVMNISSSSLNEAKTTIDKYGAIFKQALTAEIASDNSLSDTYNEALKAVDAYNEAVLRSENIYDDENVAKAKENLDIVRSSIEENEKEWGRYSTLVDDVFGQADTRLLAFNEAMKNDFELQNLADNLKGLSDLDLKAFDDSGDNASFEKLKESANEYKVSVDELIDSLVRLGYVQGEIVSEASDAEEPRWDFSETITQLDKLKDKFNILDQTYAKLFDADTEIVFEDLSSINEAFKDLDDIDNFIQRLQEAGQDTEAVTEVIQDLIAAYLDYSGVLDNVTQENASLIEQFLTEMGIENAHEIVLAQLSEQTEALALQKQFLTEKGYELIDATLEEIVQFLNEANASDEAKASIAQFTLAKLDANNTVIDTSADIENVIALANAAGASATAIAKFKNAMSVIEKAKTQPVNGVGGLKQLDYAKSLKDSVESSTYDWEYKKLNARDFKVNTSASKYIPKYSGGASTKKTIEDTAKDAEKSAKKAAKTIKNQFEEIVDFFDRRVNVLDDALSLLKTNLDNVTGSFAKNNLIDAELGVTEEKFKNYSDALNMYTEKANEALSKLPSDIAAKIKDGAVDLTTFVGDGNKEVVEAIKDYEQWADKVADCKQELAELRTAIRQLELEKFNNIMEDFTNQFDLHEDGKDLISKQIDLLKEAGELIGESFFTTQIDQSRKQLELLETEKVKLVEQMNSAIGSGRVQKGTEEWLSMVNALSDVEGNILDCKKAIEEFDNELLQLHWDIFDRIQEQFKDLDSELSNLGKLFDDFKVTDSNFNWSKEGLAQLGLLTQQYELAEYQVQQYNDEINQLSKDYLAGKYSATEYADRLSELSSAQWDAVNSSESIKDAIVDLNEVRINEEIDAIEKEINTYRELIDAQIDALKSSKDLHDYRQQIAEKTKSVTDLERQIAAMANDDSAATVAKRKQLEEQFAQARKDLENAEYDHSIEAQENALNKQLEDYEAERNAEIEALRASLEEREALIAQSFENVKANADIVGQEIANIAVQHGITVSDAIITSWKNGENAIASYGTVLSAGTSAFIGNIMGVESEVYALQAQANATADTLSYMFATRADNLVNELASSYYSEENLNYMTQALRDSLVNTLESGYNISSIMSALDGIAGGLNGVASSARDAANAIASVGAAQANINSGSYNDYSNGKTLYRIDGVAGGTITSYNKSDLEKLTKSYGKGKVIPAYASGTRNAKGGIRVVNEDDLELVLPKLQSGNYAIGNEGDQILTKDETDNVYEWSKVTPEEFYKKLGSKLSFEEFQAKMYDLAPSMVKFNVPNFATNQSAVIPDTVNRNGDVNVHYDSLVTVNGDVHDANRIVKQIENVAEKAIKKSWHDFEMTRKYGMY